MAIDPMSGTKDVSVNQTRRVPVLLKLRRGGGGGGQALSKQINEQSLFQIRHNESEADAHHSRESPCKLITILLTPFLLMTIPSGCRHEFVSVLFISVFLHAFPLPGPCVVFPLHHLLRCIIRHLVCVSFTGLQAQRQGPFYHVSS